MTAPTDILTQAKQRLWLTANRSLQTCVMAAANINILFPPETAAEYDMITDEIMRHRNNPITETPVKRIVKPVIEFNDRHNWKQRYREAHKLNCQRETSNVWKDGHYCEPRAIDLPKIDTHAGLCKFMLNMINWLGGNAAQLNVVARVNDKITTEVSGNQFKDKRYIKSIRKGMADIQGTIRGKKIQFDAKVGRDTPKPHQLKEQIKERKAGGIYEFIHNPDEFFNVVDPILYGQ